jgi:hypothetical protein
VNTSEGKKHKVKDKAIYNIRMMMMIMIIIFIVGYLSEATLDFHYKHQPVNGV